MPRDHANRPTVGNPTELLLAELQGHPLQDYVDTVRAVAFMQEAICKTFCLPEEALHPDARGSERLKQAIEVAGVRAEKIIHRIAHSLFIKNQLS